MGVSMYYMNQALFWQVVLGFASVVLPLLRLGRLWSAIAGFRSRGGGSAASDADSREHCVFCGVARSNVAHPRRLQPCAHTACYYCYAARSKAHDSGVNCPVCSAAI